MLTMHEPSAGKVREREADRLASRADHVREKLVRQREVDAHPARNSTAIRPGELEELCEDALGMANMNTVADRRLAVSDRLGKCIGNRLGHRGKCEQNLEAVARDDADPRRGQGFEALVGLRRGEQHALLARRHDDSPGGMVGGVAGVGADDDEPLFDGDSGRIGSLRHPPHLPPP